MVGFGVPILSCNTRLHTLSESRTFSIICRRSVLPSKAPYLGLWTTRVPAVRHINIGYLTSSKRSSRLTGTSRRSGAVWRRGGSDSHWKLVLNLIHQYKPFPPSTICYRRCISVFSQLTTQTHGKKVFPITAGSCMTRPPEPQQQV